MGKPRRVRASYSAAFVPTAITPAMRKLKPVKEMFKLIKEGVVESWAPGFKGAHMASRWAINGVTDTLTACSAADRNWAQMLGAHLARAFDALEERFDALKEMLYWDIDEVAVDAQKQALETPETFWRPDAATLRKLKPGDYVKVCIHPPGDMGERLWTIVHEVEKRRGGRVRAEINNTPVVFENMKLGDWIEFEQCHIFDHAPADAASIEKLKQSMAA